MNSLNTTQRKKKVTEKFSHFLRVPVEQPIRPVGHLPRLGKVEPGSMLII